MEHYQQQIEYAFQNNIIPVAGISDEWIRLLSNDFSINTDLLPLQSVEPLLVSKWNQDSPYNNWCPSDPAGPGGRCYAGCVATAMGQLLYYYRYPQSGQGSYTYTHPDYGTISANFAATSYHWENMPSFISKENDAIGELLFQLGVSVDMDYGPTGSGMWNHKAAYSLKNYFRYGPETQYYFRDSVTIDWDSLIVNNLNHRKPLYYAGWAGVQSTSGHAFVCDGYQPGNYYHFNWGWGGSQDGYFYTANLTPGGNNFNFAQEIIPLFPDTIQNQYPGYCQGPDTLNSLCGSIEDGSGWYNYQNNSGCSWLISPQNSENDSIKNIKITFLRLDIENGVDSLQVFDGENNSAPLLGSFSGNALPGILTSTGNKVYIEFHTGSAITKEGFQLDYESIIPVYCSGITTLNSPSGSIEDGSGNKNYNDNSMCRWKIMPSGGMPVTFNFTSFNTYDSADIVKVLDLQTQEILGTFSGNALPPSVTASSGKMMILFITNNTGSAAGWSGNYFTSAVGITEKETCDSSLLIYPNPVTDLVTIEKYLGSASESTVRIVNLNGQTVYTATYKGISGKNKIYVDFSDFKEPVYLLIMNNGSQSIRAKILKKE
ncbi:MAG: C10 family peptidase [Bacteroidota bacterium]